MTKRECVIEVLRGGKPPYIPNIGECVMDQTVAAIIEDKMPAKTGDTLLDVMRHEDFYENCMVDLGINSIRMKTLSRDEDHHIYEYETGSVWEERYTPTFNREATKFPVYTPEEALSFKMPVLDDGTRFDRAEVKKNIQRYKDAGYFVQGNVIGAWASCYYYIAKFETLLEWMIIEPEAAEHLFKLTTEYSLKAAEILLDCGVDCIGAISDMGTAISTLFSPACFRKYVFPWLKSVSDLCHSHNAFFHLHSHGHIENFMDGIVEAGVDLINPIGPSDNNDLAMFKAKWGDRISIMGGISTTIATMTDDEMRAHVKSVMDIGRKGGRFFPRTESGIPPMPKEKILLYLEIVKEERMKGYL